MKTFDYIIIGTGAGGGTIAHLLAKANKKILIIERGDFLPREKQNWDPASLFVKGRYNPDELWLSTKGKAFTPGTHYFVGGNTKFYGAALLRLRESDFKKVEHFGGVSPEWPLSYEELKPYYLKAEKLYEVHGKRGEDPKEPKEESPYPYKEVSHEPFILEIFEKLKKEGLKPFHLPLGVRLNEQEKENSLCIRCDTCDGFPCLAHAKSDSDRIGIAPILHMENVTLLTNSKVEQLITDESGKKVIEALVDIHGKKEKFSANRFIVSCGAINSAALLLKSKNNKHPNGLANRSDLVGRNYMCHNNSAIVALSQKKNPVLFQKTIGINDFYHNADDSTYPLGHIQLLGKVQKEMLEADAPFFVPNFVLKILASHAVGWWITSEDLPDKQNRVQVNEQGQIVLNYEPNNLEAHQRLLKKLKKILNATGHFHHFPNKAYLSKKIPLAGVAHQVGTCCFGEDPNTSVLDKNCKAHDHENLYVVDGSFFPSSGAVNPGLTIIANAIRVAEHLIGS